MTFSQYCVSIISSLTHINFTSEVVFLVLEGKTQINNEQIQGVPEYMSKFEHLFFRLNCKPNLII